MESLTKEASVTCNQAISTDLPNATSLQASEDGLVPFALWDGKTPGPHGPPPCHASRSPQVGNGVANSTVDTSGLISTGSSRSASLALSLANKLKERLDFDGLTVYVQIWKRRRTPLGRLYWEHTASVPRTFDKGYTGYRFPTIGANEFRGTSRKRFVGSLHFRGAKMAEGLRICEDDPTYLNPWFAACVMGFPMEWQVCMDTAMQSFPKSRRSSSKPS